MEELRIVFIALIPATIVAVFLRFVSRRISRMRIWWDDYLTVVALAFAIALNVDLLMGTFHGLGQHVEFAGLNGVVFSSKVYTDLPPDIPRPQSQERSDLTPPGRILRRGHLHARHGRHQNLYPALLLPLV